MSPVLSTRPLGFPWETTDPFLFCAHHRDAYPAGNERLGPAASLAGRNLGMDFEIRDGWRMYHGATVPGFPSHPHRGFETVTIVRDGLVDHSDSLGATARFGRGDVQWLTAGDGIQHAEMFPLVHPDRPNPLELFQIWLNLPRADKRCAPHFTMLWREQLPVLEAPGVEGLVVAGALGEVSPPEPPPHSWAAHEGADVEIWVLTLAPGARFTLPAGAATSRRTLYFHRGEALRVGEHELPPYHLASLRPDAKVELRNGPNESEVLLLGGRPIAEPVAHYGPFVMNTRAELHEAFTDYQRTRFGGWPWSSEAPVHGRNEGRFAKHPDGRVERP